MSIETSKPLQKYIVNGETMGTFFSAIFFADAEKNVQPIVDALQQAVDLVDNQMSNWKPNSDLTKLNNSACDIWVDVPPDMLLVIDEALKICRASNGIFDIAVGDLVNAWGFGPAQDEPNANDINDLSGNERPNILQHLQLDKTQNKLRKTAQLSLDLCGIAKGYGTDKLAKVLDAAGIVNYLVSIDGEMSAKGKKPEYEGEPAENWNIAIEKPLTDQRDILRVMALENTAIATSGDYRHLREFDDMLVCHAIDQTKSAPVVNHVASVSVIDAQCMLADAWATALMVMGEIDGVKFAKQHNMDVLFIIRKDGELTEIGLGIFAQK